MLLHCLLFLLNCMPFVILLRYEKPVASKLWLERCVRNALVLNECNWCWCNENFRYTCNARVCGEVDMFGHFNDAIQELHVGMEGHGSWRSAKSACEPGVHYSRGDLLCVCTEDGTWPSPVCRDTFRVLHSVEVLKNFELSERQKCSPTKLYLADCNVCFCPSTGRIDPNLCTQKECTNANLISTRSVQTETDEVYAECNVDQRYRLGCKNCICLRNNRLICDNCTKESQCEGKEPGENFNVDCNLCHCDAEGTVFCTINRCLHSKEEKEILKVGGNSKQIYWRKQADFECEPGTKFMKDCNICYCFQTRGKIKKYGCTLNKCYRGDPIKNCNIGDKYTKNCQICSCGFYNNLKMEICQTDPSCFSKRNGREVRNEFRSIRQDCEPLQVYKNECNTCRCSVDGKTMVCTTKPCGEQEPISLNIIPVIKNISSCPKGHSYKIDCNFCFCLSNGNALCTTIDCKKKN